MQWRSDRRTGQVVARSVLSEHVWGIDFDTESNVIDVTVSHLRRKVDSGVDTRLIRTVRGVGYSLGAEEGS